MEIQIADVSPEDLKKLQEISRRTFYQTFSDMNTPENLQIFMDQFYGEEKLSNELKNPDSRFFFANRGEETIGYLKLNSGPAQTELPNREGLEIERIYVDQSCKGMGIGKLFLEKTLVLALQFHSKYIWLGVWEKNLPAIRFYEKNGFKIFGNHGFQLGDDLQTDHLMKKILSDRS